MPMDDQPVRPQYINQQHNTNCQQFFGPISGCVFAMPGATVTQTTSAMGSKATSSASTTNPRTIKAKEVKAARAVSKPHELMTFSTHGVCEANLTLLFQQLVNDGWLDYNTEADDFLSLFSGKRSEAKIIWAGKYGKGTLVFLFRFMEIEGLITTPKGIVLTNILMGHFVDKNGLYLTHLDKGDEPAAKASAEVMEYIRIMKCNPVNHLRKAEAVSDYDEGYDPFDHQDLHLRHRH